VERKKAGHYVKNVAQEGYWGHLIVSHRHLKERLPSRRPVAAKNGSSRKSQKKRSWSLRCGKKVAPPAFAKGGNHSYAGGYRKERKKDGGGADKAGEILELNLKDFLPKKRLKDGGISSNKKKDARVWQTNTLSSWECFKEYFARTGLKEGCPPNGVNLCRERGKR